MSPSKLSLFSMLASRFFAISRRAWILISIVALLLMVLAVWLTISLAGWLFGMAQSGVSAAPEVVRNVVQQAEKVVPGASQAIDDLRAVGQAAPPPRDVSGTDPMPMARFPGLTRTHWQREGHDITVRYEGKADLAALLDYYAKGFAEHGYRQELHAATPSEERHEYIKGEERIGVTFTQQKDNRVSVRIAARQP